MRQQADATIDGVNNSQIDQIANEVTDKMVKWQMERLMDVWNDKWIYCQVNQVTE